MQPVRTARAYALTLTVVLAALGGCSGSDGPPIGPGKPAFKDLSEKEHVIDNLVLSYERRNLGELDKLLDANFTFHFSAADVADRGFPESWNRTGEMAASDAMLNGVAGPDSIVSLDVEMPYDTLQWDVSILVGPGGTEEHYEARVPYSFNFETAGGITWTATGMEALLTVRNDGTVESPQWRLVRWEDLGDGIMSVVARAGASTRVEAVSWGRVKEHYNPQPKYGDLTDKADVINNLVLSYLRRDATRYAEILDADYYRFYFSDGDVSNGLPPGGWDRAQDLLATTHLLDPANPAPNRIVSIDLDVGMSNLVWVEIADPRAPDETWWLVTTTYAFAFEAANYITYFSAGVGQAQFVVRNIGTDAAPQWRLVQWRDLAYYAGAAALAAAVEESSWGRVKSLYAN